MELNGGYDWLPKGNNPCSWSGKCWDIHTTVKLDGMHVAWSSISMDWCTFPNWDLWWLWWWYDPSKLAMTHTISYNVIWTCWDIPLYYIIFPFRKPLDLVFISGLKPMRFPWQAGKTPWAPWGQWGDVPATVGLTDPEKKNHPTQLEIWEETPLSHGVAQ